MPKVKKNQSAPSPATTKPREKKLALPPQINQAKTAAPQPKRPSDLQEKPSHPQAKPSNAKAKPSTMAAPKETKAKPKNTAPSLVTPSAFEITDFDRYLLGEGTHSHAYEKLGAHLTADGVHFAVWAPNATRVNVVGDFNNWDGAQHTMHASESGIWTLLVPGVREGALYKYEIHDRNGNRLPLKADPFAFASENPPATASIVARLPQAKPRAKQTQSINDPISIYEVHLGSWQRGQENAYLTYPELAKTLIPYVKEMGFTHIELMPISEHPFSGSWGYQPIGLYAPTSRFGTPQQFASFIDAAHEAGLKVIIDWVPGHFPNDAHGLAEFDGTHLYEHQDPREGKHQDWDTLIYNYGRAEVRNFLIANALYWLERFGIDGLRVDAVASMIYRNYSRKEGEWVPNQFGGVENLEATAFLKKMNEDVYRYFPDAATFAEESTAWPGVSKPTHDGGLGFGFKWNMGWMHDTLKYMQTDPYYRRHNHHLMTFGMIYAYTENFVLPLSHDEVVHGKGSLIGKMPGDEWQKYANLRAYFGFMYGHPGKKLLFMGNEFGQVGEWNHNHSLDWHVLEFSHHKGVQALVKELNHFYRQTPALYAKDYDPQGFEWLKSDDAEHSVYAFLRKSGDETVIVISNFTPVPREGYRIGVPIEGAFEETINTDDTRYGGSGMKNGELQSEDQPHDGCPYSLTLTLPPLATLMLTFKGENSGH